MDDLWLTVHDKFMVNGRNQKIWQVIKHFGGNSLVHFFLSNLLFSSLNLPRTHSLPRLVLIVLVQEIMIKDWPPMQEVYD